MDLTDARSLITLICFIAFIGIVIWAYSKGRRSRFDEAAQLPFADDDMQQRTIAADQRRAEKHDV